MNEPAPFTAEDMQLMSDRQFFPAKARIMAKVRQVLEAVQAGLKTDLVGVELLTPPGFDPAKAQFVKGEHLEQFPYQYLDFPKHFVGDEKFTFRSLFWWGHHFIFALILEGEHLLRYKRNLINRYHEVAGRDLHLSLAPTPWEWHYGEGYTLPITHDRKPEVSAVLAGRKFVKLARYIALDDPAVTENRVPEVERETWRALLPIITP